MTASVFINPFSYELGSSPSPDEIASELQLLGLLRTSGLSESANRRLEALVAKAPFIDAVTAAANATSERKAVDGWLAETHGDAARTLIPSASLNADGLPRFVVAMPRDASDALIECITRELSHDGADSELRNFLDEILIEEMAYIDFDPGVGFAVLTAATAPIPATAVCAVSTRASEVLALDASVEASAVDELVTVIRNVNGAVTVDELMNNRMSDTRELVVHAGVAGAVPSVVAGALSAIRDGRIGALTWRCVQRMGDVPMLDEDFSRDLDNAGTVLSVLGFHHFAIAQVEDDVELVPLSAVSGNAIVISLSREYLTRMGVV
ncbi:MAG: hypothetical protein ABI852_18560 [Gemmatimonadaceae bacterium]